MSRVDTSLTDTNPIALEHYGAHVTAVEPGGVEVIPETERHGKPSTLFTTWTSPNLEFATIAVGIIGPLFFGLSFWGTISAIVIGTALGCLSQAYLSTWGPTSGLCQMVLSRTAFGRRGNLLPAGLNALVAGVGWFAVNSISGALALHALVPGLPKWLCLAIVVAAMIGVAFFGHNLVHAFERYAFPVLVVVFAGGAIIVFSKAHPGGAAHPIPGAWLIEAAACFGYAAGWNPYAADYTRYLQRTVSLRATALWAGLGVFVSCVVLEAAGAAMVSAAGKAAGVDPGVYTSLMPTWIGKLTLLCIAVGAICANALNVYSGAMSAIAAGVQIPARRARAYVAVIFGVAGFVLALFGLPNAGSNYENFLLVIAYWIGPWLGVVLADRALRRGQDVVALALAPGREVWAGPIAMLVSMVISIWLFSNQTQYKGLVVDHAPKVGDITFLVGFALAAGLYVALRAVLKEEPVASDEPVPAAA